MLEHLEVDWAGADVGVAQQKGVMAPRRRWSADELGWLRTYPEPHGTLGGDDVQALAELFGRSEGAIRAQLHKLGLVRRYEVNERFFDAWSAPMAWVLGILLSDGHLETGAATIVWSSTNRQLLESVRACLGSTHRIFERPRERSNWRVCYGLAIARSRLRAGVNAIVPVSRQGLRYHLPAVPAELLRHFVRGYFEGNGSASFREPIGLQLNVTGNPLFLENLRLRLQAAGVAVPARVRCNDRTGASMLQLAGRKALLLADYLYRDASIGQRVEAKYQVYQRCLEARRAHGLEVPDAA